MLGRNLLHCNVLISNHQPRKAQAPAPQPASVVESEDQAPLPDRLVRDRDPALREEIFDLSKAETEPVVHPHGVGDDLGWKAVSAITWRRAGHLPTLSPGVLT
jgi:hypothetical protein